LEIFTFDFVPYGADLRGKLGYPVGRHNFDREIAAQTYHNHVEQFLLCEEVGFDGISLNEHHGSPYGLDNSPNVFLSYIARATSKIKLTMLGNLLPLHAHPLRVAEELAMLDIITRGRLIAGFVRGIPREHLVYSVPLSESKARFDEALDVIFGAWKSDVFSHHGRFFNYDDIDMWPRPYQQPHPPVWMGALSDDTSRQVARRSDISICVNFFPQDQVNRQLKIFHETAAEVGRTVTDDDVIYGRHVFVAETEAEAIKIAKSHVEYYWQNLIHEINMAALNKLMAQNPDVDWDKVKPPFDYGAATLENLRERGLLILGTPDQVYDQIMEQYEMVGGFGTLLAMIRMGAMPQDVLLRTIRLMGEELVPRLHKIPSKVHKQAAPAAA
jgi:alkanesulfonate monooxygenase SsuD/methylene tetrahydromethanopterin reductase-like flavin-dependent oxidoreductase (luciferase family)